MPFPYRKVLIVGATDGIGLALAEGLVKDNVAVIAVGRRQERLRSFLDNVRSSKAYATPFDVTRTDQAQQFASRYEDQNKNFDPRD